jgi:hypothetical protein
MPEPLVGTSQSPVVIDTAATDAAQLAWASPSGQRGQWFGRRNSGHKATVTVFEEGLRIEE